MKESGSYDSIRDIINKINEQAIRLEEGQMSLEELEELTDKGRELYERLVVLRYKAIESIVRPEGEEVAGEDEVEDGFTGIRFDIPKPKNKNQFKKKAKKARKANKLSGKQESIPLPDQPIPFNNPNPTLSEQEKAKEESEIPEEELKDENQTNLMDAIGPDKEEAEAESSLNEQFSEQKRENLASKLGKSPIDDLHSAVGINQKFLFMNDLFKGEVEDYKSALDQLNSCSGGDEAEQLLQAMAKKHEWDTESKTCKNFRILVERRYL